MMKLYFFIFLFSIITFLLPYPKTEIQEATISTQDSPGTITFIGNAGKDQVMSFEKWEYTSVNIDGNDLTTLDLIAEIDITSLKANNNLLRKHLVNKSEWFDTKQFPKATVHIHQVKNIEGNKFEATANIGLKGIEGEIPISFEVIEENPIKVQGEASLNRQDFKVDGKGPKDIVPITFEATLPEEN